MTRAPRPARSRVAYGPASAIVRSTTVTPASGGSAGSLIGVLVLSLASADGHRRHPGFDELRDVGMHRLGVPVAGVGAVAVDPQHRHAGGLHGMVDEPGAPPVGSGQV